MRVLSTKLELVSEFSKDDFYAIISGWLKGNKLYRTAGDLFLLADNMDEVKVEAGYCTIETFTAQRYDDEYLLFKLSHLFYTQTWETEIILHSQETSKEIIIHINCSGDTTPFDDAPVIRTEIIRCFVNSGKLRPTYLFATDEPVYLTGDKVNWLAGVMNGNYEYELPLIFASKIFNSSGYELDIDSVARKLAGVAYVLAEADDNFVGILKEKTNAHNPYNGHIGVYYQGHGISKGFSPLDVGRTGSLDKLIIADVAKYVTAQVDRLGISWDNLYNERVARRDQESRELLDEAIDENGSLDEQLKQAKEKIHKLVQENAVLTSQKEALQRALREDTEGRLILAADIPEFFDGEQYDLLVTILTKALSNYHENTRPYDLLKGVLENNKLIGNGKRMEEVVKSVLSSGENPKERDFAALREVGFDVVSDNTHYKLVYKGDEKYTFILFKTASDKQRGGKNTVSDIRKKLSVYS